VTRRYGAVAVWLVLGLSAALTAVGVASAVRVAGSVQPFVGVEWIQSAAGPVAIAVEPGGPAWVSGLRPGDLLVSVDGKPAASALDAGEIAWSVPIGEATRLEVRRGASTEIVRIHPRIVGRDDPYGYLALVGFAFLASGTLVAARWPTVRGARSYAGFAAAMFVRLVFSHTGAADPFDWFVYSADLLAGLAAPALLVHFALDLARRSRATVLLGFVYGPAAATLLAIVWLHPAGAGAAYRLPDPTAAVEGIDRFLMLVFGIAVVASAVVLVRAYGAARVGVHRSQVRWAMWGMAIGFVPFLALLGFPWALGATDVPGWARFLAVVPMLAVPAAFTTALARYRLHDLDLLLRRLVAEVSALFLTFAVYAAVVFALRYGLDEVVGLSRSATRYLGLLFAAISYPQLRHLTKAGVDRAFYRKRYSYRVTLQQWSRELAAEVELEPLLVRLRDRVRETLAVERADVFVLGPEGTFVDPTDPGGGRELRLDDGLLRALENSSYVTVEDRSIPALSGKAYLFGMKVKDRLRAVLAVSERDAVEPALSSEDRSLLATLSSQAATAIEAARLLREVRQQAEEVRALHARERTILESSAVGLAMLDDDGIVLAWNRALEEIYGLPREDAVGRDLSDVFPLHFVRFLERRFPETADGSESRVFRYTLVDRRGTRRILNLTISAASTEGHARDTRVVTFDDVSEQVKLEEQVVQQERLASLGLLAAGVAHEVNTPLTGISSYTQLLLEELAPEDPRRELLRKIDDQTRRASDIANSLLDLAHPERVALESIDLNALVEDTLRLFDSHVRGRGIEMDADLEDALPRVRGHRGKIQQVLLNLLINARDAVGEGGRVVVRTLDEGDAAALEVVDDGAGIAEEDLPRIFDPFFTTKGRGRGTGLGLSICYGIVREHGGEIRVESEPGTRTSFRVELPAVGPAAAAG